MYQADRPTVEFYLEYKKDGVARDVYLPGAAEIRKEQNGVEKMYFTQQPKDEPQLLVGTEFNASKISGYEKWRQKK
ncbi:MAG: hypothetical protein COT73_09430 [Bdellovibrio sp. CG10_big_fil_rev_8_21_14_0_10_47_8]|nr:MAG: hypothetical protein COT73_09430 [Bdellovibrio sp. CG10_big_fil_rev_8_21_14_0_10_47_8]